MTFTTLLLLAVVQGQSLKPGKGQAGAIILVSNGKGFASAATFEWEAELEIRKWSRESVISPGPGLGAGLEFWKWLCFGSGQPWSEGLGVGKGLQRLGPLREPHEVYSSQEGSVTLPFVHISNLSTYQLRILLLSRVYSSDNLAHQKRSLWPFVPLQDLTQLGFLLPKPGLLQSYHHFSSL